jgi:hypothetical protein
MVVKEERTKVIEDGRYRHKKLLRFDELKAGWGLYSDVLGAVVVAVYIDEGALV